jgi:hypothetical protein
MAVDVGIVPSWLLAVWSAPGRGGPATVREQPADIGQGPAASREDQAGNPDHEPCQAAPQWLAGHRLVLSVRHVAGLPAPSCGSCPAVHLGRKE